MHSFILNSQRSSQKDATAFMLQTQNLMTAEGKNAWRFTGLVRVRRRVWTQLCRLQGLCIAPFCWVTSVTLSVLHWGMGSVLTPVWTGQPSLSLLTPAFLPISLLVVSLPSRALLLPWLGILWLPTPASSQPTFFPWHSSLYLDF